MDSEKITKLFCGVCHKWKVCVGRIVGRPGFAGAAPEPLVVEHPICADCKGTGALPVAIAGGALGAHKHDDRPSYLRFKKARATA